MCLKAKTNKQTNKAYFKNNKKIKGLTGSETCPPLAAPTPHVTDSETCPLLAAPHNTYAENLKQTHAGSELATSVSVRPCSHCFVGLVGHVLLLVSSNSSDYYNLSSPSSVKPHSPMKSHNGDLQFRLSFHLCINVWLRFSAHVPSASRGSFSNENWTRL